MSKNDQKMLKLALKLVLLMDKGADKFLHEKIVEDVKLHAKLAVGAALIPIPGADLAASAANIWGMYASINSRIGLKFSENLLKSIGAGVATNLAGAAAMSGLASALKFIPGIGTIGGAAILSASLYAITLVSGAIYLQALCVLAQKKAGSITEEDLKGSIDEILKNKDEIKNLVNEAKKDYKAD